MKSLRVFKAFQNGIKEEGMIALFGALKQCPNLEVSEAFLLLQ
jgi:hypothetical protein